VQDFSEKENIGQLSIKGESDPLRQLLVLFCNKRRQLLPEKIMFCHDIGPWKIKHHQGKLGFCARDAHLTRAKWEAGRVLLV